MALNLLEEIEVGSSEEFHELILLVKYYSPLVGFLLECLLLEHISS